MIMANLHVQDIVQDDVNLRSSRALCMQLIRFFIIDTSLYM